MRLRAWTTWRFLRRIVWRSCGANWQVIIRFGSTSSGAWSFNGRARMRGKFRSWITTRREKMTKNEFAPVTPGMMLKEEFLDEYGLSQNQLAKAIGISPNRIAEIVHNRRRISADTAVRLSLYFGNSPEFWMNLQIHYDLKLARRKLKPEDARRIKARRAA